MRWQVHAAYTAAVAVGILSSQKSVEAFQQRSSFLYSQGTSTTTSATTSTTSQLHVGGLGWDNDNFLDSLSKGSKAREEANEAYFSSSRFGQPDNNVNDIDEDDDDTIQDDVEFRRRAAEAGEDLSQEMTRGAEITAEMKAKMKAAHTPEEEASQGGKMFRELLSRAQEKQRVQPPPPPPAAAPPATPAAPLSTADMDLSNMSVEQQAALFRQLMQQQQQQQAPPPQQTQPRPPPPPPAQSQQQYPPQGAAVAPDGRRIGRNRDADAIVNSADLYFAQLKLDSAVRNTARYSGNEEYANQVFVDPLLNEIKIQENPYTADQRKKERELYETIPEEMLSPSMFQDTKPIDKTYAGVSYKKMLEQRRNRGKTNTNVDNQGPAQAVSSASKVAPQSDPTPVVPPPVPVAPPAPVASTPPAVTEASPQSKPSSAISGDFHRDTRTLMGLTLKHRGGPGFGVGRIQGADINKFEDLAKNFLERVQQEAAVKPEGSGTPVEIPKKTVPASARGADLSPPPDVSTLSAAAAAAAASVPVDTSRADSMIACIEGAVLMYRNSPPGLRDSVMVTLRAALLSAISTCNELLATSPPVDVSTSSSSSAPTSSSMNPDSMIACIEGAVQVYRSSPVELRDTVLVTLRAALLSAVYTCNELITQSEGGQAPVQAQEPPKQEVATKPTAAAPFVEHIVAEKATPKVYSGNDENTKLLNDIYARIKEAAGDGKMGLSKDMTPQQAKELSNDITDMRMLLVDELENGIPEKETNQNYAEMLEKPAEESKTAKKYTELLAKAKAEKKNETKE